jgi:cupin fold WbuC family metalloprotein
MKQIMKWEEAKNNSFYKYIEPSMINDQHISELIRKGEESLTGRARYCLHANSEASQQLMLIYHDLRTTVPVHRHKVNGEFIIVIKGSIEVKLLNEEFDTCEIIELEAICSPRPVWIPSMTWHTIKIVSNYCLFYESSIGPFRKENTDVTFNKP